VVEWFGAGAAWPTGVDSQCHQTVGAPFREDDITEQAMLDVTAAGDTISLPSFMLRISPAAAGSSWNRTALCGLRDTTSFARSFAAKGRSGFGVDSHVWRGHDRSYRCIRPELYHCSP